MTENKLVNKTETIDKKKVYKPGLMRDVDKQLVEKLNDREKLQLTIDGYDLVSDIWDATRQNFWPELLQEIEKYIKPNTCILDVGCGNGRLVTEIEKLNKQNYNLEYFGIDPSLKLIEIARNKYPVYNFEVYDGININNIKLEKYLSTLDKNKFDQIISIAVLHHIPPTLVNEWLQNIFNITKENTISIFTTWNLGESNYDLNKNKDAVIGFVHYKNTRYVHYYDYNEIKNIFEKVGYKIMEIKDIKRESGMSNTVVIVKK